MKVEGCVAVVVGGARGIGKACCLQLADKGAKVCCADVLNVEGEATVSTINMKHGGGAAIFVPCDVTKDQDVHNMFIQTERELGKVTIVINTAAIIHEYKWQTCLDVNIGGMIRVTERALQSMGKQHGGHGGVIINMSSHSGLRPECWGPVYCATKYAVIGYTRSWAELENYSEHGVRFNVICPSSVETAFQAYVTPDRVLHTGAHNDEQEGITFLTPEFIAEGCMKVIEDDTMNGQAMRITIARGHEIYQFDTDHPKQ